MIKNALLSLKKNWGKSLLLFVIMALIANLVMAGLSIKNATTKSMQQIRESMGSEVTLSYNMQNLMKDREKGTSMEDTLPDMTIKTADLIKNLDYVASYNYTQTVSVDSSDIEPVAMSEQSEDSSSNQQFNHGNESNHHRQMDDNDFTISGNTNMSLLSAFSEESYVLSSGRLLTEDDEGTKNCVISSTLAEDNDLEVGDTFRVYVEDDDGNKTKVKLKIVGIYEIESTNMMGGMSNRQSPYNTIYTSLTTAQTLNGSTKTISSATYYLDDPENQEAFTELANALDIDWDSFTLQTNDRQYQMSVSSLENMEKFSTIFLWVVVIAGSCILALILILTLRSRFYEFGVLLSLGQSKLKIIGQQLIEVGLVALIAFTLSLGTGKMAANVMSHMLASSQNSGPSITMNMNDMPGGNQSEEETESDESSSSESQSKGREMFKQAMNGPASTELDVSLTPTTALELAGVTAGICMISILLPSLYIFRLSPREILIKKEG